MQAAVKARDRQCSVDSSRVQRVAGVVDDKDSMKGPYAPGGRQYDRVRGKTSRQAVRADSWARRGRDLRENYDPTLRPLDLSNTTSEPLSSCGLCLRLIGD